MFFWLYICMSTLLLFILMYDIVVLVWKPSNSTDTMSISSMLQAHTRNPTYLLCFKVLWTDWTINKEVGNKLMDVTLFHCYSAMIDRIWDHPIIGIRHWTVDLRLASSLVYHIVTVSLSPIAIFNYIDALLVCDTQTYW